MLQIDNLTFNAWGRKFFDRASVTLPLTVKWAWSGATAPENRRCSS